MTYMINKIETNASKSIQTITKTDANNLNTKITKQKEILQSVVNQITQDNDINEEIDEIAEHILSIGGEPLGTMKDYLSSTKLKEAENKKIC